MNYACMNHHLPSYKVGLHSNGLEQVEDSPVSYMRRPSSKAVLHSSGNGQDVALNMSYMRQPPPGSSKQCSII